MVSRGFNKPLAHSAALVAVWLFLLGAIGFYAWRIVPLGLDLRQDFWTYSAGNHPGWGDVDNAIGRSNGVLQQAAEIERAEALKKSPAEIEQEKRETAAGHPPPTLRRPGEELFDSPLTPRVFAQRWQRLWPLYRLILRGWVANYEHLQSVNGDEGNFGLDYPPLRLLTMTLWTWHVHTVFPGLNNFPRIPRRVMNPLTHQRFVANADMLQPMLKFNALCEGVSALAIFVLVWLWVARSRRDTNRWGDSALLIAPIVFAAALLLRGNFTWQMPMLVPQQMTPLDQRVTSLGWWLFLLLRFLAAVCLARFLPRPFRAPACGLVAATLAWLNPASMLDSFGFPQWDAWLPPFFLLAGVLVTLDCWVMAGLILGVGCMFKGQLLFAAPVLLLCPLFAGWPGRFFRAISGLAAGAGLIVWPWLVTNARAEHWIVAAAIAALVFVLASLFRRPVRTILASTARAAWSRYCRFVQTRLAWTAAQIAWLTAALFSMAIFILCFASLRHHLPSPPVLLALAIVFVPWWLPRRLLGPWMLFVFSAALWLVAFDLDGSWSWWRIGFLFGTRKHQVMQLGPTSLSNLSSILGERYGWRLHDAAATLNLPFAGAVSLDLRDLLATIYFGTLLLCTVAAGIHLRRRDPRFLIAMTAPWALFPAILTQMAARYPFLPAVVGSTLVAVSAEMSLLPFVQTVLACVMLGNQVLSSDNNMGPLTHAITAPTHPDLAWGMLTLSAILLVSAVSPSIRWRRRIEQI
jgi:hypothetical protein